MKPLLLWKSNKYYIFLCVCVRGGGGGRGAHGRWHVLELVYPDLPCNAPPYCLAWPRWLHHIFRQYLINGMIFGTKLLNVKCVF